MMQCNVVSQHKVVVAKSLLFLLFIIFLLSSTILLSGCITRNKDTNKSIPECYDVAGNLLRNCDEEISDRGIWATVEDKFHDKTIRFLKLNTGYEEWEAAGCPSSGVDYAYYYIYDDTGDNYALLYIDPENACFEIPLENEQGQFVGRRFIAMDGTVLQKNIVSGRCNSDRDEKEINGRWSYYDDQANKRITSLDYFYLPKLDPENSTPYMELENPEDAEVPMLYAIDISR